MRVRGLCIILLLCQSLAGVRTAGFCSKEDKCVGDESTTTPAPEARYDHTHIYHVELATLEHVQLLQQLEQQSDSCSFMGHAREPGQKLTVMVAAHKVADFDDLLRTYNIKYRILNTNFQVNIDANYREVLPSTTAATDFDWRHYFHLETIYAWLELMAEQHPGVATLIDMGESTQGVPIKGLKVAYAEAKNKTSVFIESGIHAREWIAPATATYIINELLNSNDANVKRLARAHNWLIFPVINPDGYKFTFRGDRMWRKNRSLFGICRGVDLNRNYPYRWNTTGTSGDPCRYDYSGPAAGSEIETQRLMNYVAAQVTSAQIRTYIALHSYSQLIMFPYSSTPERVENYDDLSAIGKKAAERIKSISGRVYKSGSIYETIYPSSGGSKDWVHGHLKLPITFTFELRGPPDSDDLFILAAKEIEPTAQEAFAGVQTIIEEASNLGYYN